MAFSKVQVLAVTMLLIIMVKWDSSRRSSMMVEANDTMIDGVPVKVVHYSRNNPLWSPRGVRSLMRKGRQVNPDSLDAIEDSADLPSCIEICMMQNCYGAIPTYNTIAPTTIS